MAQTFNNGQQLSTVRNILNSNAGDINALQAQGLRSVQDVASLLANTSLTYSAGSINTVTAGDILQTRAENFSYQVAASGAANQHLTTAGGVKLYSLNLNVQAFGAVGDGVTNDTAAIQNAIAAAAVSKYGLTFEAGKNYLVSSPLSFSNSANTVPSWVEFNGCVITASGSFSGSSVVYVENPQGKVETFWMSNVYIDATGVNYGFYLKGGQDGRYLSLQVVNAVSNGFLIQGETGFGIYYNVFDTCKAGGPSGGGNGSDGFLISGVGGRFANSNTFVNCASQFNAAGGFKIGISSGNTFIGCASEENVADAGFVFGNTVTSVSIVGGFTENNDYLGTDTSFRILSGAAVDNIRISGGRHNGTTNGFLDQDGIMYDTTDVGDVTIWNTDLKIRNLTLGGTGANIVSADATSIRFGDTLNPDVNLTYSLGSNALRWDAVYCNDIDQNSTTGGTGSAGAGNQYITLRIDGVNYKLLHDGTV